MAVEPDNPEAHYLMGVILVSRGKAWKGLLHFSKAMRIDPGHVKARRAYELTLRRLKEEPFRKY
jgi:hypothetical protein